MSSSSPPVSPGSSPASCFSSVNGAENGNEEVQMDELDLDEDDSFTLEDLATTSTYRTPSISGLSLKSGYYKSRSEFSTSTSSTHHPFSAIANSGDRHPPRYEKRGDFISPPSSPPRKRARSNTTSSTASARDRPPVKHDPEHIVWDDAINTAVDKAECIIDLTGYDLSVIPPSIADLGLFVNLEEKAQVPNPRALARVTTAPAVFPASSQNGRRAFAKGRTSGALLFGAARSLQPGKTELMLLLGNNKIEALPPQLFTLKNLVVLSLRSNQLTEIPPCIGQLTGLRDLNIALNRLRCLPPEINHLSLTTLTLHPNPFLPLPENNDTESCFGDHSVECGPIPSLCEIALRRLMKPDLPGKATSTFEELYTMPAPPGYAPSHVASIVDESVLSTGAIRFTCPSPRHVNEPTAFYRQHSIERMEWRDAIAGVKISPKVPLRWRGCMTGCLNFLDPDPKLVQDAKQVSTSVPIFQAGLGEDGQEIDLSDDEV